MLAHKPISTDSVLKLGFCASTGRTATMRLAKTLNSLPSVIGLHEGHIPGVQPTPILPMINLENRKAWFDSEYAIELVSELRNATLMKRAAASAKCIIDVGYYNAPLLKAISHVHPHAAMLVIFRRCENFVRSATITTGEDLQPAGWPDKSKSLTQRELFISLGRLSPEKECSDAKLWPEWSAIQRNIWLWYRVNSCLLRVFENYPNCHAIPFEYLEDRPDMFWTVTLKAFGLLNAENHEECMRLTQEKINSRKGYQIEKLEKWSFDEQMQYRNLAAPLERDIYEKFY